MTQTELESRPDVIQARIEPLWSRLEEGKPVSSQQRKAVAEGFFRIGVHPGTVPATALRLLARASRLDSSNPKFAYHLGLLYLRHGQLDQAEAWLSAAAAVSPVNHRIWAHLALAHSGLHHRQAGVPGYADKHRKRADSIAETIGAGRDNFGPESERAVLALLRPGETRWSGIHDIIVHDRLRGRTTMRARDPLAAGLETIAGQAGQRQNRTAAFAVLAIQWMMYGYPPGAIRRMIAGLPAGESPALRLLNLACDLFEADRADLPAMLATCLADGSLPDILIALIHRQRLFWRPLRFPDLGAHTAARQFSGGDLSGHEQTMRAALKALSADLPNPMRDAEPAGAKEPPALSPGEQFAQMEGAAGQLASVQASATNLVKALGKKPVDDETSFAQAIGDYEILTGLRGQWEASRDAWLEAHQQFKGAEPDPADLNIPPNDFSRRMEECESKLQQSFGNRRLEKNGPKLEKQKGKFPAVVPAPSPETLALADAMSSVPAAPASSGAPADESPPPKRDEDAVPPLLPPPSPPSAEDERGRVTYARELAEWRLDVNFAEAWQTLDTYLPKHRYQPAVVLLRGYLAGHQAEADHRLGRTAAAVRHWNGMLADDPVHLAVLHNLAVAQTTSGDPGQAAWAWRRYLEALYLDAVLRGDVRRDAAERARVHRVLAGSFGTGALTATFSLDGENDDMLQVPLALSSVSKVAITTAHLRLEELNHFLSYRGPALLLGADRSAGQKDLTAARDARVAYTQAGVELLPRRVRGAFGKLCLRDINKAYEDASKTSGRTRRTRDDAEEETHAKWVRGQVLWKLSLFQAIRSKKADWALTGYSGEVIANLRLLDELPLDAKDKALLRCVQQLGLADDPVALVQQFNQLSKLACDVAEARILETALRQTADPQDRDFPDQFRRVGRSWARNSIPGDYLEFLDDPQQLYARSVRSAFDILRKSGKPADDHERDLLTAAVVALERWTARLPGATGPARVLAMFLGSLERYDEAEAVLSQANGDAFSPQGRNAIALSFIRLDLDRGEFPGSVTRIRKLLSEEPGSERLRSLLTEAYGEQMRGAARERRQALREQLEAARKECEENAVELSAESTLGPEKRDYIREILDAIRPK